MCVLVWCGYLLLEDGLGLTAETFLLAIVAPLSLRENGVLALLVLCHLVECVLLAVLVLAERAACLGYVDLEGEATIKSDIQLAIARQSVSDGSQIDSRAAATCKRAFRVFVSNNNLPFFFSTWSLF